MSEKSAGWKRKSGIGERERFLLNLFLVSLVLKGILVGGVCSALAFLVLIDLFQGGSHRDIYLGTYRENWFDDFDDEDRVICEVTASRCFHVFEKVVF